MKTKILLLLLCNITAFASCDCNNAVLNAYEEIKQKVPKHFEGIEKNLDETIQQLDKTIVEKKRELELIDKEIENKSPLIAAHQKEVFQLVQMHDYIKNQNDVKVLNSNIEISKSQNTIIENSIEVEKNSKDPYWKK